MFVDVYSEVIASERQLSCTNTINEEVPASESLEGIDIITDARHSSRWNSKFIDDVYIGYKAHQVIGHENVSRDDDNYVQRHELKDLNSCTNV